MTQDLDLPYCDPKKGSPLSNTPSSFPAQPPYRSAQSAAPGKVIDFRGSLNLKQTKDFIRVQRVINRLWSVTNRIRPALRDDFKIKFHAIAYARALSHSLHLPLFIDDALGCPVKQSAASLTYPAHLE